MSISEEIISSCNLMFVLSGDPLPKPSTLASSGVSALISFLPDFQLTFLSLAAGQAICVWEKAETLSAEMQDANKHSWGSSYQGLSLTGVPHLSPFLPTATFPFHILYLGL